jgi:fermentation-respiration switch protein FrsA (DUF1100 family)
MHGGHDELVPADTGQRLYAAAAEPKLLWYEPDAAHVQFFARYPAAYEARVVAFFDRALKVGLSGYSSTGHQLYTRNEQRRTSQ